CFMKEKDEFVGEWIEKGDHDLGSAKLIFLHIPEYFDTIAFHCQQAVEKYLKALLIYFEIDFKRSHDLMYLLDLLSQSLEIKESMYDSALLLNVFSVQIRYPDNTVYLSSEELETSISIAQDFRDYVIKTVGIDEI